MLKNNKGSFLVLSLIATATVLGVATYLYSSNYLNTKEEPNTSKEEVSMNDETVLSEVNQRNLAQASTPTPTRPSPTPTIPTPAPIKEQPVKIFSYSKKKKSVDGKDIYDIKYFITGNTPKSKAEVSRIIGLIRRDSYISYVICPFKSNCNTANDLNHFITTGYKFTVKEVCPRTSPTGFAYWVTVNDVDWFRKLPSGSLQATGFITTKNWNFVAPADNEIPVDCSLVGRDRSGVGNTNPNIVGGEDISTLEKMPTN